MFPADRECSVRTKLSASIVALLVLVLLSACVASTPDNEKQGSIPSIDKKYWNLVCGNTNVIIYKNLTGAHNLDFELVSAFPFKPDELTVELETDSSAVSYTTDCYRDPEERTSATAEPVTFDNGRYKEYPTKADQGERSQLYRYVVGIQFDVDKLASVERINGVTLKLKGETKRYTFSNVVVDAEKTFNYEGIGISSIPAVSDAPLSISSNGLFDLTPLEFKSNESFTLNSLSLFGEKSANIATCSVTITHTDGTETRTEWDNKTPLLIRKGESVTVDAFCNDPQLAGVTEALTTKYIMVNYTIASGKKCTEIIQGIYRIRENHSSLSPLS